MRQLWQALMMVRRCDRGSFWRRLFYVAMQSVLPLLNLYVLKLFIDTVQACVQCRAYDSTVLLLLLAMCVVALLGRVVSALNAVVGDVLSQRLIDYMSDVVQRQAATVDLSAYDMPEYHDILHRAQQESTSRPLQIMNSFMSLFGAVISIVGVTIMLAGASWWVVPVMVVAVVPSFLVRLYKARSIYTFRRTNTQLYRRTGYYGSLLTGRGAAAEMRAFRLAPLFRRRFVEVRHILSSRLLAISRRLGAMDVACSLVEIAAMFVVVWLLASKTIVGAITIGSFVMLFEAFRRGQGFLSSLVGAISSLYDNRLFVSNLFEFLDLRPVILPPDDPLPVPDVIGCIEFRDVTFRYPDMDRDVLCGYSLTARRGEICRIEGRNGYGKSTLVKLLLRLYDPQQGAVLVDGIDIRRFDPVAWRRRVAVLFQDFVRYACTAEENMTFGNAAVKPHTPLVDFVDRLPHGNQTLLGRVFDGGSELSMGQWQRIALERALSSDAPVMILDEPTAWLDTATRRLFAEALDKSVKDRIVIIINHQ